MRFGVLGPLVVWDGEGREVTVPETKVRALLADLLAHDGAPVSADRLIDDLWGDAPPGRPSDALRAKVSQLRRVIGVERVVRQPPGYRLRLSDGDAVDAERFGSLVAEAQAAADPRTRGALLTEALELWRGPAYADVADAPFARGPALRLAEQRLSVLEARAEARLETGGHALLAGELADLVAQHPLRERLRALQMRALYAAGRQSEALAAYEDLRGRLAEELGVDPGPELAALHEAVLRQEVHKPDATSGTLHPVLPGTARASSGLPVPLTPLVGRDDALTRVSRLLVEARLVTLTGPGGVGKTRLAVAAAAVAERDGTGSVRLVEFSGIHAGTAADLAQVVAAALGVRDDTPAPLPGTGAATPSLPHRLAAALRDRRALLVPPLPAPERGRPSRPPSAATSTGSPGRPARYWARRRSRRRTRAAARCPRWKRCTRPADPAPCRYGHTAAPELRAGLLRRPRRPPVTRGAARRLGPPMPRRTEGSTGAVRRPRAAGGLRSPARPLSGRTTAVTRREATRSLGPPAPRGQRPLGRMGRLLLRRLAAAPSAALVAAVGAVCVAARAAAGLGRLAGLAVLRRGRALVAAPQLGLLRVRHRFPPRVACAACRACRPRVSRAGGPKRPASRVSPVSRRPSPARPAAGGPPPSRRRAAPSRPALAPWSSGTR
ncbi:BTAD domain-containing putative transcriptional regulator [Streptomyces albogriseolus]|uniref:BTAD domain-containing putative transcriptional regulator n=1 Tax=Streptomyces albogriseolus TaxID=1887 RepID=UPI0037BDCC3F